MLFLLRLNWAGFNGITGNHLLKILPGYEQGFGIELDLQVSWRREIKVLDQTKPNVVTLEPESDANIDLI